MRYPTSEKLEIIRLVERSHLPIRRTLDKLGIPRAKRPIVGMTASRSTALRRLKTVLPNHHGLGTLFPIISVSASLT